MPPFLGQSVSPCFRPRDIEYCQGCATSAGSTLLQDPANTSAHQPFPSRVQQGVNELPVNISSSIEMTSILTYTRELYEYVWSFRDPRVESWNSSVTKGTFIIPLVLGYVYIAKVGGPRWMKDRKPYDIKGLILAFNVFTVVANLYVMCRMLRLTYLGGGYSFLCQGTGSADNERDVAVVSLNWWYLLVRIADFLDTFFFVARKKFSHITFLHVSHHALIVLSGWLWVNFGSDGQPAFGICLNAFVHVIMYTYYFLAALGPSLQKYLWWKKYLTSIQIAQLVAVCTHMSLPLFIGCNYPKAFSWISMAQLILGVTLFTNFYLKTYRAGGKSGPPLGEASKRKGQ